jgi:hypothetical protein
MSRTKFQEEFNAQVKQACDSYDVRVHTEKEHKKSLVENLAKI